MISAYLVHIAIIICIEVILAMSLQISIGYTGLLNLGHIAFFGIGAYTSALLTMQGVPWILAFLAAGIVPMFFAYLLSIPTNKLKGDYLALATMGFSFVIYAFMLNWTTLTRGPLGIPGITKPILFGIKFSQNAIFLILALVIAAATYYVLYRIVKGPFGLTLQAVRDNEDAAKALGKNTFKIKTIGLMISAFFAGIAGSIYAHYITFIDPSSFAMMMIIPIVCMIIIGGLASLKGTLIATVVLVLIPEILRFVGMPSSILGPARQIIYALILIFILLYKPKGFYGKVVLS